ncbi:MAG: DUF4332 domain-containing protein [Anaerolineae bacterium]|nr:DUF4332 domain-containing protein [Anaerolineae bacterium]
MAKLTYIEGVGDQYAEKLRAAGIRSTEDLLQKGATPQGRKELADQTGLNDKQILKWVNHCDLFRIKGVGSEYAELLEAAGVDTVPELAQRNAQNLHRKALEINLEKKLVRRVPTLQEVSNWVEQASKLERVINY